MTDEQRARAEANKAAALARRAASLAAVPGGTPTGSSPASPLSPSAASVVPPERCRPLNAKPAHPTRGSYVLLWVQSAQRARHNEALELAVQRANAHAAPLVAVFGATAGFPGASERHLGFMYEGLVELRRTLESTRGIHLLAFIGADPSDVIAAACQAAIECVVDAGYTRVLRQWRAHVAAAAPCLVTEVESEVVVPVYSRGGGAGRPEPAAATLRPKILSRLAALTARALEATPLTMRLDSAAAALALLQRGTRGDTGAGGCAMDAFPPLPLAEGVDACLDALDASGG